MKQRYGQGNTPGVVTLDAAQSNTTPQSSNWRFMLSSAWTSWDGLQAVEAPLNRLLA